MTDPTSVTSSTGHDSSATSPDDDSSTPMQAEFDHVACWTREAVDALGNDHAVPAGCRGSASPAALAWLGEACELTYGRTLLDCGGGIGGPAAYAAERFGVRPILVEPMLGACGAASHLFGIPVLAGSGDRLPLASGSVDAAWCLGVLCTTTRKAELVAELRRVLLPGSHLGLLLFQADASHPDGAPDGNSFPSSDEVHRLLQRARFEIVEQADAAEFADAPLAWTDRIREVEDVIERTHGDDPRYAVAQDQSTRMGRLLADGTVTGRLVHAVAH